jgi:succinate dehydrogenase / fumarate reductase, membrane anchor subunit
VRLSSRSAPVGDNKRADIRARSPSENASRIDCLQGHGSWDRSNLRDEVVSRHVREFGSARDGLREGRLQRLMAIAVIPLSLHFAASILALGTSGRKTAADWLSLPVLALVVILVVLAGIMHALIGVGSVVLDYVHTRTRSW